MSDERVRIAQDVHDVVAHALVAINVQSGVGAHLLDRDVEQARRTLRDIKQVSSEALDDLRATLGLLRSEDAEAAPVSPTTRLGGLSHLSDSLTSAGVEVDLDIDPEVARLPGPVDATSFRIVQEALTNVLRHASSTRARVSVSHREDQVVIDVHDDGTGGRVPAGGGGSGNGLRGMRERAVAMGGTLEAGPGVDGGWRVLATLPTQHKG